MRAPTRPRHTFWLFIVAGLVVSAMVAMPASTHWQAAKAHKLINVTFREDFFDSDAHAGIYAGIDKGFWQAQGLDVKVEPGQGSVSTVQQVAQGNDTFGYANAFSMVQQVVKGADVTAIASTRQLFDGGVVYWADAGISKPSDLQGKNYIGAPAGFVDTLLPLFAKNSGGWDLSKMHYQALDPTAGNALFSAHKADAITGTVTQILLTPPYNGQAPKIFRYSDYGINPLSFVIVANSRQARGYPGLMRKFVTGYLKAWTWACANPRQAVTMARQHYTTTLSIDQGVALWQLVCSYLHTPATKGQAPGWMSLADWQGTIKILTSNPVVFGATQNVPPAKTLYTNEYVNDVYPAPCAKGQRSTKKSPCHVGKYR
jgi:NitT/TauT family transport system substrate-binding protein